MQIFIMDSWKINLIFYLGIHMNAHFLPPGKNLIPFILFLFYTY